MTSKEIVDRIKNDDYSKRYSKNKLLNIIKKDLEDLQTLKTFINIYLQFQLVYDDIDHYEIIPVKQYIGNSGCLLLTEDKMKKILDICND